MNKATKIHKIVTSISIAIFIVSLTQNCFCTSNNCINSFVALVFGWIEISCGDIAGICWFANILLILSWILTLINSKHAKLTSILSTLLCLVFLFDTKVVADEAGHFSEIISNGIGYWLWVTSSVIMVVGNLILIDNKASQIPISNYQK